MTVPRNLKRHGHSICRQKNMTVSGEIRIRNGCLSALSPRALSLLRPYLSEITLREGLTLWDTKKPASEIYFPVSGLISIVVGLSDGNSVEVGNICTEAAVGAPFEPDQFDLYTRGVVQIGGTFIRVPASQLFFAAKENREIENLTAFCRDWILLQAQQEAVCNAVHSADKRFCRWLFQTCERMETDTLLLTQEMIASLLRIRRTTVTLIAQTLQADELIQYRRGKISVMNRSRLRSAACECCNSLVRERWAVDAVARCFQGGPLAHLENRGR